MALRTMNAVRFSSSQVPCTALAVTLIDLPNPSLAPNLRINFTLPYVLPAHYILFWKNRFNILVLYSCTLRDS
jgi:hypothetical protein